MIIVLELILRMNLRTVIKMKNLFTKYLCLVNEFFEHNL